MTQAGVAWISMEFAAIQIPEHLEDGPGILKGLSSPQLEGSQSHKNFRPLQQRFRQNRSETLDPSLSA
jgi:hypothetical protein